MTARKMARAHHYWTLEGQVLCIDQLISEEQQLYRTVKAFYNKRPTQSDFSNYWRGEGERVWGTKASRGERARLEIVNSPIYKICQDLDARLGIREGHVAPND